MVMYGLGGATTIVRPRAWCLNLLQSEPFSPSTPSARTEQYKSLEDSSSAKVEAKKLKMQEETRIILQQVDAVREEKYKLQLKNDAVEE